MNNMYNRFVPPGYDDMTPDTNSDYLIKETLDRFIKAGVLLEKVHISNNPSVTTWNINKKCEVNNTSSLEMVPDENGNLRISTENNRFVSMHNYDKLEPDLVEKINSSEGILVSYATYGKPYYRFNFIPTK